MRTNIEKKKNKKRKQMTKSERRFGREADRERGDKNILQACI